MQMLKILDNLSILAKVNCSDFNLKNNLRDDIGRQEPQNECLQWGEVNEEEASQGMVGRARASMCPFQGCSRSSPCGDEDTVLPDVSIENPNVPVKVLHFLNVANY